MSLSSLLRRIPRKAIGGAARILERVDSDRPCPVRVPVLMYHKVGPVAHSEWWVATDQLAAQIRALRTYGYEAVTLADVMDFRAGRRHLPRKPILLTFDDGYRDILTEVLPLLQEADTAFKVTVFVPTGRVGGDNTWDTGIDFTKEPPAPHMTWDEIRSVAATGLVDFQSHTVTHPNLAGLRLGDLRRELFESRRVLERELDRPIRFLSYPFSAGARVPVVRQLTRFAGYQAAVGADEVIETDCRDRWNIRRLIVRGDTTVSYQPGCPQKFFFGPALLADPDVPCVPLEDVRIGVSSTESGSTVVSVQAVLSRAVKGVRVALECRTPAGASTQHVDIGGGLVDLQPGRLDWQAPVPAVPTEARLLVRDGAGCVTAYQGDWQPVSLG